MRTFKKLPFLPGDTVKIDTGEPHEPTEVTIKSIQSNFDGTGTVTVVDTDDETFNVLLRQITMVQKANPTPWIMEVLVDEAPVPGRHGKRVWKAVTQSRATEPYHYASDEEARKMLEICYPQVSNTEKRVRNEITGEIK